MRRGLNLHNSLVFNTKLLLYIRSLYTRVHTCDSCTIVARGRELKSEVYPLFQDGATSLQHSEQQPGGEMNIFPSTTAQVLVYMLEVTAYSLTITEKRLPKTAQMRQLSTKMVSKITPITLFINTILVQSP